MLSWPWALLMSRARMIFDIAWCKVNCQNCSSTHFVTVELSFSIGAHCSVECKLKKLVFFQNQLRLLFITSGGFTNISYQCQMFSE